MIITKVFVNDFPGFERNRKTLYSGYQYDFTSAQTGPSGDGGNTAMQGYPDFDCHRLVHLVGGNGSGKSMLIMMIKNMLDIIQRKYDPNSQNWRKLLIEEPFEESEFAIEYLLPESALLCTSEVKYSPDHGLGLRVMNRPVGIQDYAQHRFKLGCKEITTRYSRCDSHFDSLGKVMAEMKYDACLFLDTNTVLPDFFMNETLLRRVLKLYRPGAASVHPSFSNAIPNGYRIFVDGESVFVGPTAELSNPQISLSILEAVKIARLLSYLNSDQAKKHSTLLLLDDWLSCASLATRHAVYELIRETAENNKRLQVIATGTDSIRGSRQTLLDWNEISISQGETHA